MERRGVAKQGQHRLTHGHVAVQDSYFNRVLSGLEGAIEGRSIT
jgi:hypothetical protein